MSGILRSILDYGGVAQEELVLNFQKLSTSRLEWTRPDDKKIYDFAHQFFQNHLELPQKATLLDYFDRLKDIETSERVKDLEKAPAYVRTNFVHLLSTTLDQQNQIKAVQLFKEGQEIASKGLVINEEKKQGVRAAISHFTENAHALIVPEGNAKLRGELRVDGQHIWDEYLLAKTNKDLVWGKFTGINAIDKVCHGIKKGELWVHAAYAGELKTTFSTNWAYNLVTRYRSNVFYVSLEMTYEHIRRIIYVIHSGHKRFELAGYKPLDYRKVRDGQLTPAEEAFLQLVIEDFVNNPDYGRFEVWRPDEDITTDEIKMQAELANKQNELGLLIVDHGGLVEARKKKRNKDYVVELNSVIRDTKKLALNFNHGEAIPILLLFQINRQGKDEADKNEGRYKAKALAYSNECVVAGTLTKTSKGLLPIESIEVGAEVWSTTGWKKVLATFEQGVKETFQIRTREGFQVTTTASHRVRVLEDGEIKWVETKDLIPRKHSILGDFGTSPHPAEPPSIPSLGFLLGKNVPREDPLSPAILAVELAYLKGSAQKGSLGLEAVGVDPEDGVPTSILTGPRSSVVAYLRGLWDASGSIKAKCTLSIRLPNRSVAQGVQLLMSDLGIETTLGKDKVLGIYSKAARRRFTEVIGFTEPKKMSSLKKSLKARVVDNTSSLWPVVGLYLELFEAYTASGTIFPRKCASVARRVASGGLKGVPTPTLKLLVGCLPEMDHRVIKLQWLLANTRPYLVSYVTPKGPQQVYDLEVTGDHEYATAGFLSHNCERSADVITTTYLNEEHRANGTTIFCNLKNRDNPIIDPFEASVDFSSRRLFNFDGVAKGGGAGIGLEDNRTGIETMFNV